MNLTEEQEDIFYYCKKNKNKNIIILINAIAGSGKTSMLKTISNKIFNEISLYLAYNNSIAKESRSKFPQNVNCKTTHGLAYEYIIQEYFFELGNLRWSHIEENISYLDKNKVLEYLKEYFLSKYLHWEDYSKDMKINQNIINSGNNIINKMLSGKIPMSFDYSLKLFHLYLNHNHQYMNKLDILMLDEAGDLNEVTLEIFKLIPAKLKIAVGDKFQNIYGFNHTINCFNLLEGKTFSMTQSFRVSVKIAKQIEYFFKKYLNNDFAFKGTEKDEEINSRVYITRTNASLIRKINELQEKGISYKLIRDVNDIFKIPIMITELKYKGQIEDPHYYFLQDFVNNFYENKINIYKKDNNISKKDNTKYIKYIEEKYYDELIKTITKTFHEDIEIISAISLIKKMKKDKIKSTYKKVMEDKIVNEENVLFLTTAHSSKGLEFDEVILDDDIDKAVAKVMLNKTSFKEEKNKIIEKFNNQYFYKKEKILRIYNKKYQKLINENNSEELINKEILLCNEKIKNEENIKNIKIEKSLLDIEVKVIEKEKEYNSELNLYYVACTRASKSLKNAKILFFNDLDNEKDLSNLLINIL